MRELREIKESEVEVGKWYSFDEYNLPNEKYYDTGVKPKYVYLFSQVIEYKGSEPEVYYWQETELPYSIDTFRRCEGSRYWAAVPKIR